jgi:hypothetical protein
MTLAANLSPVSTTPLVSHFSRFTSNAGDCVVDTVGKNVPQVSKMPEKKPEVKNLMTLSRHYVHD